MINEILPVIVITITIALLYDMFKKTNFSAFKKTKKLPSLMPVIFALFFLSHNPCIMQGETDGGWLYVYFLSTYLTYVLYLLLASLAFAVRGSYSTAGLGILNIVAITWLVFNL